MHLEWVPDEYAVKTHYISEWDGLPEIISQINQACRHAIKAGLQIVIEVRTPKDSHIINAAHATVEEDDETA